MKLYILNTVEKYLNSNSNSIKYWIVIRSKKETVNNTGRINNLMNLISDNIIEIETLKEESYIG